VVFQFLFDVFPKKAEGFSLAGSFSCTRAQTAGTRIANYSRLRESGWSLLPSGKKRRAGNTRDYSNHRRTENEHDGI
jgi:hypothetical protein